jgi:Ni,Fe-hydrogenase III component G
VSRPTRTSLADLLSEPDGRAAASNVLTWPVAAEDLAAAAGQLARLPGARLADLFAADGEEVAVRLVYALDADRRYVVVEAPVDGLEYPLLSQIAPAAFYEECEVYEQFGLRPAGGGPLNRVALPPNAGPDFPRLGHAPLAPPGEVHAPHVVGGQAFEFPTGPVRAAGAESLYIGLVTSGEEVVDLYLFTWHKHRGLETQLRGLTPQRALFGVERVEGTSAVANGWAFARAVETATGVQPPEPACHTRAVVLELERIYNHAAALAALCQSTGLSVGQAAAEAVLERLLRVNAAAFGHRYLFGVIEIGGVSRAPDTDVLRRGLRAAHGEHAPDRADPRGPHPRPLRRLRSSGHRLGPAPGMAGQPADRPRRGWARRHQHDRGRRRGPQRVPRRPLATTTCRRRARPPPPRQRWHDRAGPRLAAAAGMRRSATPWRTVRLSRMVMHPPPVRNTRSCRDPLGQLLDQLRAGSCRRRPRRHLPDLPGAARA